MCEKVFFSNSAIIIVDTVKNQKKERKKKYMSTLDYRSKTLFLEKDNGIVENYWPIACDFGYGGCKIFSSPAVMVSS